MTRNTDSATASGLEIFARCARVAEAFTAGNGWINAHNVIVHGVPYGGVGKSGMGGGVVSPDTLNDYLRPISVVRPL